jgi:hypothetical protein
MFINLMGDVGGSSTTPQIVEDRPFNKATDGRMSVKMSEGNIHEDDERILKCAKGSG